MWSMCNSSLLADASALSNWYKEQIDKGVVGVSHDGVFSLFIVCPPDDLLASKRVDLVGVSDAELMLIGKNFITEDDGKVLVGDAEVFRRMYLTDEYQARIKRINTV